MEPCFVTYVARVGPGGKTPHLEIEANGRLLSSNQPSHAAPVTLTALAVEEEFWAPLNSAEATHGRVEIIPDDDSDNCLFWQLDGGIIQVRAFGTILQLDVNHIKQPCSRLIRNKGGEK